MATSATDQVEATPNSQNDDDEFSYYDVLVIGRTGMGKSTLANKLLGINPETKVLFEAGEGMTSVIKKWDIEGDSNLYFEIGESNESVTKTCKVLSNENTMIRVLDAPGFNDVDMTQAYGVTRGNSQCFRWILQALRQHDLRFSRILYLFPVRGLPERADGTIQEEIKVMHDCFGQRIFDLLVIAVTNNKRERYQQAGFLEDDLREIKEIFLGAYEAATESDLPKCPPIIYVPFIEDHTSISNRITGAEVISDAEYLSFSPEYPIYRDIDKSGKEAGNISTDLCKNCAILIITEKSPTGGEVSVHVRCQNDREDEAKAYDTSSCHPFFVQKYSRFAKITGGIFHIITLGFSLLCYSWTWPGFTNSEKVCVRCRQPAGYDGCCPVKKSINIKGKDYKVDHAT
jgi:energy-coupling factor transporter ATP-binding protein EcfA2